MTEEQSPLERFRKGERQCALCQQWYIADTAHACSINFAALPINVDPRYTEEHRFDAPLPRFREGQNRYRWQDPSSPTARELSPMQRAHWEWCDAVLATQTDEGPPFLPPHLLLSKALAELMETIVKLNQQFAEDDPNRSR